jgi:hypothetical protein
MASNDIYNGISKPIDSLINYILDIKPYHTKFFEIIEKYYFYDNVNVIIDESLSTNINIQNNPLCKPYGYGVEWDEECGFDPYNCCDLFACIGGYGLIYDNSDILVNAPISFLDSNTNQATLNGDYRYDERFQISSILGDDIIVEGDVTSYLTNHKYLLIVPIRTYNIFSASGNTLIIEGNHVTQFSNNNEFNITRDRYNSGTYILSNVELNEDGNTVITASNIDGGTLDGSGMGLGYIESKYICKNQGAYEISSASFSGGETTITIDTTNTPLQFDDVTELNKHGSIQLRTGLFSPRRVYITNTVADDEGDYVITNMEYFPNTDTTVLVLGGNITTDSNVAMMQLIGYEYDVGFDGFPSCSSPQPYNVHTTFSEYLEIVIDDTFVITPDPTPST